MNRARIVLPLTLALLAAPVAAQEAHVPGRGNPNGAGSHKVHKKPGQAPAANVQSATYAQIYLARKIAREAAERKQHFGHFGQPGRPDRPDHPERPERPERPEHPGRP